MKRLFSPAILLMNRLRYTTKFMVLASICLVALAVVVYSLVVNLGLVIGALQREMDGLALIKPVSRTMQLLQRHRGLSSGLLGGDATMRKARALEEIATAASFTALEQQLAAVSALSAGWKRIETDWNDIRKDGLDWPAERNLLAHTKLIGRLQALKSDIADQYSLSFDPDIDSHYLIDTACDQLPVALEKLALIRALGTGILARKRISEIQKLKLHELITELNVASATLASNFDKTSRYNPGTRAALATASYDINKSLQQIVDLVQEDILAGNLDTPPATFFGVTTMAIDAGYLQLDRVLLPTAEALIKLRIERAERDLYISAGSAAFLMLVACYFFGSIYYATIGGIRTLASSARRFAGGDMAARVNLDTRDELSLVGDSFNDMADGLDALLAAHLDDEQRLNAIVNSALDAVIQMDADGNISGWNKHAEEFFGWSRNEAIGRKLHETIIPLRHRAAHIRGLQHFKACGEGPVLNTRVEIEGLHRAGHEFAVELAISSIKTARGVEFCAFARDITARRRAEAELRIAAIAFETEEGIIITDAEGIIIKANRSFARITGYSAEDVIGQSPTIFRSGRHDARYYEAIWNSLVENKFWQGEIWDRRNNGEEHPVWLSITAVGNEAGRITNYVGAFSDITQRKKSEETIHHLAFYDPLTALPNRRLLFDRLQQAQASSIRSARYCALLFIDLDNFKTLNDTLGHDIGDLLLKQVAERLVGCVRDGDTVARLGGDEFVVMLEDLRQSALEAATQVEAVSNKILGALGQTYQLAGYEQHSTPSIGVTLFAGNQETVEDLMKRADLAMYQAKAAGRNTLRFFDPAMQAVVSARAALEEDLRAGLRADQFRLYYQLQVNAAGHPIGAEALVRWQHPQRGVVSPAEFIPLAEDTGLILPLGHWVLETACRQLAAWAARPEMAQLTVAVNVSARQFHHRDFVDQVLAIIEHTGANPLRLKLELTESLMVDDVEDVIGKMTALKAQGVGFSLDDFGTGYSSLSYLKRLPLDQLKIDQGFVRDILIDTNDAAIARMVIVLAESLGLAVIAEGVETTAQRDFLAASGCHAYQGYLFARPLALDQFDALVTGA